MNTLTGGVRTTWGKNKAFPASKLTSKYAILHKLLVTNWLPSNHKTGVLKSVVILLFMIGTGVSFNLGKLIFNQIARHAECSTANISVGYPSLILEIMARHNVDVVRAREKYEKDIEDFSNSKKLFQGHHVQDIQGEMLFPETPTVSKGVALPMSQDDLAVTQRFLKADLAFLEAQERSITVRKKEIFAFISKLESAGASSTS